MTGLTPSSEIEYQSRLQLAFKKLGEFSPSDATTEKDRIPSLVYLALRPTVTALIEYQGPSSFRDLCTRDITFKNFSKLTPDNIKTVEEKKGRCTEETYSEFCKNKIPERVERLLRNAAYIYFSNDPSFTDLNRQYFSRKSIDSWLFGAYHLKKVSSLLFTSKDPKQVHSLLQLDCNPNIKNVSGITPLHLAAKSGRTEIATLLIDSGAVVDSRDSRKRTPLCLAASGNSIGESIQPLIDARADLHALDVEGRTPLHMAVDIEGRTPLHLTMANRIERVSILIRAGADLYAKDNKGRTPLMYAEELSNELFKQTGEQDLSIVELLRKG